jgi:hypothetical protein
MHSSNPALVRFWPILLQKPFCTADRKFSGRRRGYQVNMWETSSHGDELTGHFGNELDALSIDDRGLFRLSARKLSHGNFGLLQQNRTQPLPKSPSQP